MTVRVLFFAHLRERCGTREATVELPVGASAADLWRVLSARYPALEDQRVRFAVNQVYVDNTHALRENDEFALIPPVSGGVAERDRKDGRSALHGLCDRATGG